MTYTICEIEEKDGRLTPVKFVASTSTLTDARKKAYAIVWNNHKGTHNSDRPNKRGIFGPKGKVGKVTWCTKCNKILWNDGKAWYSLASDGKLKKKVV